MAIYKDRKLVPVAETWDLQPLLGKKTVDEAIRNVIDLSKKLIEAYKQRLASIESFVAYHALDKKFDMAHTRLRHYLFLSVEQDSLSPLSQKKEELEMKLLPYWQAVAAEEAEVLANKDLVKGFLKDERLKDIRRGYELIFRREPHVLPPDIAAHHAKLAPALQNSYDAYTVLQYAETKYEPATDSKGKKHEVSKQTYNSLMRSADRTLRKNAQESYRKGELAFKETFSRLLGAHWSAMHRLAQANNFADQVDGQLFGDNADKKLVESLYKAIKSNLAPYRAYKKANRLFLSRSLNIPSAKLKSYDSKVDFFPKTGKFTIPQAKRLILNSVSVLGSQYVSAVQKAFDSRWIDFHMTPNKRSGAFSQPDRTIEQQYILTNFDDDFQSVSTLAHEIGHSMHSYHCHANNPYELASYPIFTAEVASNFSELLLTEEIIKNSTSDEIKFLAVKKFVDNFDLNVYYAGYTSEYEYQAALLVKNDQPLKSWSALSDLYRKVYEPYVVYKDWDGENPEATVVNSVKMPHFYYNFYLYKYIIGMIGALALMAQFKKNPKQGAANYLKFIGSGTQNWPVDVLKSVGVDLYDQKTLNQAFALFGEYVEQYVRLGEKLFKVKAKSLS